MLHSAASSAACVQTVVADGYGQSNAYTTSFNLTGHYYYTYAVEATAGVKKLDSGDSCTASGSSSGASSHDLSGTLGVATLIIASLAVLIVLL